MDCYLICCSKKSRRKFVLGRLSYRRNFFILRLGGLHITRAQESKSPQNESIIFHHINNKLFLLRHTALCYCTQSTIGLCWIRDRGRSRLLKSNRLLGRAIKKLIVQKRYSRKGKLNDKKNSCTPINPKKYSCFGLKNFFQGIWKRKKFLRLSIISTLRIACVQTKLNSG